MQNLENDNILLEKRQKELRDTLDNLLKSRDTFIKVYEVFFLSSFSIIWIYFFQYVSGPFYSRTFDVAFRFFQGSHIGFDPLKCTSCFQLDAYFFLIIFFQMFFSFFSLELWTILLSLDFIIFI